MLRGSGAAALASAAGGRGDVRSVLSGYLELTKPRITLLVLVTAAAGFYLGSRGAVDPIGLLHLLVGVAFVAAGTSAMNQVVERDIDARMKRTRNRPLPTGRVDARPAALFSVGLATIGTAYLAVTTNLLTAGLAAATFASYVWIYTPLKRVHSFSTVVGAVPGALPILGGWTAATGTLDAGGWALFAILFVWQLPHFLTLAWNLREDYEAAGLRTLAVGDPGGLRTRHQTLLYTLTLLPVSLMPAVLDLAGPVYFTVALLLGLGFVWKAVGFWRDRSGGRASRLFRYSVVYLPVLLLALVVDKL